MTKKVEKSAVSVSPRKTLKLTNHMRAPWVVPTEIRVGLTKKDIKDSSKRREVVVIDNKFVMPNDTVEVDAEAYKNYYSKCKPFQAMVDQKLISTSNIILPEAALKNIPSPKPPEELEHTSQEDTLIMEKGDNQTAAMQGLKPINK